MRRVKKELKPEPRRIRVGTEMTPKGRMYDVELGRFVQDRLSEEEAGMLLYELLLLLPEVPREAAKKWQQNGREPEMVIVVYYKAKDGEVAEDHRQIEEQYGNTRRVVSKQTCCMAHADGSIVPGFECEEGRIPEDILPVRDDPVSLKAATDEAVVQQAMIYCQSEGISMNQLIKRMEKERA